MLRRRTRMSCAIALLAAVAAVGPAAVSHAAPGSDPGQDAYCNYSGSIVPGPPRDLQALDDPPVADRASQTFSFRTGLCFGRQYKREPVVVRWVGTGRTFAQIDAEITRRPSAFHVFGTFRDSRNVLVADRYYQSTG